MVESRRLFAKAKSLKSHFNFHEAIVCGQFIIVQRSIVQDNTWVNQHSPDGFAPLSLAAFLTRKSGRNLPDKD